MLWRWHYVLGDHVYEHSVDVGAPVYNAAPIQYLYADIFVPRGHAKTRMVTLKISSKEVNKQQTPIRTQHGHRWGIQNLDRKVYTYNILVTYHLSLYNHFTETLSIDWLLKHNRRNKRHWLVGWFVVWMRWMDGWMDGMDGCHRRHRVSTPEWWQGEGCVRLVWGRSG